MVTEKNSRNPFVLKQTFFIGCVLCSLSFCSMSETLYGNAPVPLVLASFLVLCQISFVFLSPIFIGVATVKCVRQIQAKCLDTSNT